MKDIVPKYFKNLKYITWNFTEAGHGKGPMDGIGGCMKRKADEYISHGADVTCAADLVKLFRDSKITVLEVTNDEVLAIKKKVQALTIPPIKNIMKVHQITFSQGIMYSRTLSCFECQPSIYCDHYTIGEIFKTEDNETDNETVYLFEKPKLKQKEEKKQINKQTSLVTKDPLWEPSKPKSNPTYFTIYSSDSDEDAMEQIEDCKAVKNHNQADEAPKQNDIDVGTFVLVSYQSNNKKSTPHQFVGVTQSKVTNEELEVTFF